MDDQRANRAGGKFPTLMISAFLVAFAGSFFLAIAESPREKMMPFAAAIKDTGIAGPLGVILLAIVVIPVIWKGIKQRIKK
jgi:hypothetical protein